MNSGRLVKIDGRIARRFGDWSKLASNRIPQVIDECAIVVLCATAIVQLPLALVAQEPRSLANREGLRLSVSEADTQPALTIALPGEPGNPPAIRVLFPEHVTAKKMGN